MARARARVWVWMEEYRKKGNGDKMKRGGKEEEEW